MFFNLTKSFDTLFLQMKKHPSRQINVCPLILPSYLELLILGKFYTVYYDHIYLWLCLARPRTELYYLIWTFENNVHLGTSFLNVNKYFFLIILLQSLFFFNSPVIVVLQGCHQIVPHPIFPSPFLRGCSHTHP